jgi:hypothetical protein
MDKIIHLISIQNVQLLNRICDDKFTNDIDKLEFINKYHKYNYHVTEISKDKKILKYYFNRIINIQKKFV